MSHRTHASDAQITTVRQFESAVLTMLGAPHTKANYAFLNAWIHREGGGGRNNPLNTTLYEKGSSSFNSVNVRNYPSLHVGALATYQTLQSPYYRDVVAALRSGHPSRTATYSGLHTWSGGGYSSLAGISGGTPSLAGFTGGSGNPLGGSASGGGVGGWIEAHVVLLVVLLIVVLVVKK